MKISGVMLGIMCQVSCFHLLIVLCVFSGYGGYDDYNGYNDGYGFGSDRFGRGKVRIEFLI